MNRDRLKIESRKWIVGKLLPAYRDGSSEPFDPIGTARAIRGALEAMEAATMKPAEPN